MLEQPAEPFSTDNFAVRELRRRIIGVSDGERHIAPTLVGPLLVILDEEFLHEMAEMLLAATLTRIERLPSASRQQSL